MKMGDVPAYPPTYGMRVWWWYTVWGGGLSQVLPRVGIYSVYAT